MSECTWKRGRRRSLVFLLRLRDNFGGPGQPGTSWRVGTACGKECGCKQRGVTLSRRTDCDGGYRDAAGIWTVRYE